jgi:hypothetical protein
MQNSDITHINLIIVGSDKMKKVNDWMKNHTVVSNIIISVLASMLFFVFLQSPLQYLMVAIPEWLGDMGVTFVDTMIRQAARASLYSLMVSISIFGFILISVIAILLRMKEYNSKISDLLSEREKLLDKSVLRINTIIRKIDSILNPNDIDKENDEDGEIIQETELILHETELNLNAIKVELEKNSLMEKYIESIDNYILLFALSFFIFGFISLMPPHVIKSNFDTNIAIIRPYTSEATINQLESEWVQMKTYSDYSDINQDIAEIKAKHNIDE